MLERLFPLRTADQTAGTAGHRFPFNAFNVGITDRAMARENNLLRFGRTFRKHHVNDLRDNVTGTTNHHFIANAQPQTLNFIGVMQRCVADQHARHLNRFKTRHWGNGPGTTHLEFDVAHEGHLFLSRELKRHRPTRRTGDKAKLFLQRERVDLNHHAINIKTQRRTIFCNLMIVSEYFLRRVAQRNAVADRQAPRFKLQQTPQMGIRQHAAF